jgi:hypothetical protein
MRYVRKFAVLLVVLYLVTLLSGADQFISSAIADSPQPLVIRTADGEVTVGSVQILCGGSDYSISFDVDDPYEIYSSIVTFRFNSGGVTRVKSFGHDDCAEKTETHHRYNVPAELIKSDDVQIAASAMITCDGKTYLTPKVFSYLPVTVTTVPEIVTTTTIPVTSTTVHRHKGGGAVVTTTTTPTTVHGAVGTTTTTQVPATTTTVPQKITTTTTTPIITTTTTPIITTTTTPPRRPRLPYTGSEHNWYMIGSLLVAAGLLMWMTSAIDSRLSRRSKNTE